MSRAPFRHDPQAGLSAREIGFVVAFLGFMIYFAILPLFTDEEGDRQLKMLLYFKGVIFEREKTRLTGKISYFLEMYGYLPGDFPGAGFGRPGNGNGRVELANGEAAESMRHLEAAFPKAALGEKNGTVNGLPVTPQGRIKVRADPPATVVGCPVRLQWVPHPKGKPGAGDHFLVFERMDRGLARYLDEKYDDGDPAAGDIRHAAPGDGREVDLYARFRGW